jgi:son of sevenless-like protein
MSLTREEIDEWKEKRLKPTRHRVLTVFTMWMEDHNMVRQEPHVARKLQEFLASIPEGEPLALTAKLMLQALDRLVCLSKNYQILFPLTISDEDI